MTGGSKWSGVRKVGVCVLLWGVMSLVLSCQAEILPSKLETPVPTIYATTTATAVPSAKVLPTIVLQRTLTLAATVPPPGQEAIVPILMYHRLGNLGTEASELDLTWTVSPKNFQAQLAWLAGRGYQTISMAKLAGYLKRGEPIPLNPVVISFDDGWEDSYSVAYPALKKQNLSGTFYVYTNAVGHSKSLSWAQIEEMAKGGMDIESHTVTHPHLRTISSDDLKRELVESKANIERHTGKRVTSLAYPFGEYDAAVVDAVKRAGYESAASISPGYRQRVDQVYSLRRIRVSYNDTLQDFASRLP